MVFIKELKQFDQPLYFIQMRHGEKIDPAEWERIVEEKNLRLDEKVLLWPLTKAAKKELEVLGTYVANRFGIDPEQYEAMLKHSTSERTKITGERFLKGMGFEDVPSKEEIFLSLFYGPEREVDFNHKCEPYGTKDPRGVFKNPSDFYLAQRMELWKGAKPYKGIEQALITPEGVLVPDFDRQAQKMLEEIIRVGKSAYNVQEKPEVLVMATHDPFAQIPIYLMLESQEKNPKTLMSFSEKYFKDTYEGLVFETAALIEDEHGKKPRGIVIITPTEFNERTGEVYLRMEAHPTGKKMLFKEGIKMSNLERQLRVYKERHK